MIVGKVILCSEVVGIMKAKDAIRIMSSRCQTDDDKFRGLSAMFVSEVDERVMLRTHGRGVTSELLTGVINEVSDWAKKVGRGIEMKEESIEFVVRSERGAAFVKYSQFDPKAAKQIEEMRHAYRSGRPPIVALTSEGLDAIGSMMVASLVKSARQYVDSKKADVLPQLNDEEVGKDG